MEVIGSRSRSKRAKKHMSVYCVFCLSVVRVCGWVGLSLKKGASEGKEAEGKRRSAFIVPISTVRPFLLLSRCVCVAVGLMFT